MCGEPCTVNETASSSQEQKALSAEQYSQSGG
uniref:Uncharacterized protein n=1 Tax=Anguilla anguilla TaxID=7936 RepID=A0A0E9V7G1_ANGAN